MDFKKISIIVTLGIIATSLAVVSCGFDNEETANTASQQPTPISTNTQQPSTNQIEHDDDSFSNALLGSFIGSWLGNNIGGQNSYPQQYNDDYERRIPSTYNNSTINNGSKQNNIKDITPPSSTNDSKSNERPKQSITKSITDNKPATAKTGIGNGGTRGSVSKSAAS